MAHQHGNVHITRPQAADDVCLIFRLWLAAAAAAAERSSDLGERCRGEPGRVDAARSIVVMHVTLFLRQGAEVIHGLNLVVRAHGYGARKPQLRVVQSLIQPLT